MSSQVKGKQVDPIFEQDIHGPTLFAETKHFLITHPSDPSMQLVHTCLEGPENGVYARGVSRSDTVKFPSYWKDLVRKGTITVHLTPVNRATAMAGIFVETVNSEGFLIGFSGIDKKELAYNWYALAERADVPQLLVEREKEKEPTVKDDSLLRRFSMWLLKFTI